MGQPATAQDTAKPVEVWVAVVRLARGPSLQNLRAASSMFSAPVKTMECEMRWPW